MDHKFRGTRSVHTHFSPAARRCCNKFSPHRKCASHRFTLLTYAPVDVIFPFFFAHFAFGGKIPTNRCDPSPSVRVLSPRPSNAASIKTRPMNGARCFCALRFRDPPILLCSTIAALRAAARELQRCAPDRVQALRFTESKHSGTLLRLPVRQNEGSL